MIKSALARYSVVACFATLTLLPASSQSVTVSPTSIAFGNQAQGTSSPVHKVTLRNGQKSAITISSISTNLADYTETNTCPVSPATLAAGAACTISVTFTPSAQGSRNATLTVVDTGLSSPQLVTLTGTGTAAILESIAVTPSTASIIAVQTEQFAATGTYSDGSTQTLTTTASWTSSSTSIATVGLHTGLAKGIAAGTATITAASGKISGSASLTVSAAVLTSITVSPTTASLATGKTQQFTATGTYNNGTTQNLTKSATWSSSATSVATISSSGLATAISPGTATITATSGTISGSGTLTVTGGVVLTSIAVTPSTASIAPGSTQQFTATGTYSNGTTKNLTTSASWTSSSTSIATVGLHTGLATGVAAGTATITATSGKITGSAALTVTPVLTSISVTPNPASVAAGYTQQFTATGTYSDGSTQNLTTTATWTSSSTSVATVSGGLAAGVAQGTATITATSGAIGGSAALTVTAPLLTSISVTPHAPSIAAGTTEQFTATGNYSDGSTQNLTSTVTWSSSQSSVATIAVGGLATGLTAGTSSITATSGSITGTATLTVSQAALLSIAVTPANPSFALGTTLQLAATGTYSDGSTLDLTATTNWSSANASIATVSQGAASSVAVGSTSITATSGTINASTTVTVTAATLVSIAVTPAIPTLPIGLTQQFTATGTFTDESTQNITSTVQWSSSAPTVATISSTAGLATGVAQGTATITAISGSVSGSAALTVTSATLVSISVTPASPSIAPSTSVQFTATGSYTDGSTQNLTSTATWSSDTPATAAINNAGLATSLAQGTANISATSGSVSESTPLTVTAATLVSIAIAPSTAAIAPGTTQAFTATGTFSDGTTQNLTQSGHWSSTVPTVATISDTPSTAGLASTLAAGTTTISVSSGSVSGSATLVVNPVALASIAITPQTPSVILGATQQFTATGTFTDGSTQNVTSVVNWSSSTASTAIVSNLVGSYGLATSSGQGTATISATSDSINASTMLTVTVPGPTLVSIAITPANPSIAVGTTQQFTATGTYSDGSTQNLTNSATWSSSVTAVATVSSAGLATGVSQGASTITATSGSITGTSTLTVTGPSLVSISLNPTSTTVTIGNTAQFTATGTYSDGSTQNITSSANWASSGSSIATVLGGLVTGVSDGTANITASLSGITSPAATADIGTAADYYVATDGNDTWAGTLWDPNATGTNGPFATIAHAQTAVQAILANPNGRTTPITVLIRNGTYYQQALTFTSADAGTATLQVFWENYPNEAPVLSGGMLATGWTNTTGSTYQTTLPASTVYFENLFYNGGRRLRPRVGGSTAGPVGAYLRNAGPIYLAGSPPPASPPNANCAVYVSGSGWECFDRFYFNPGDLSSTWTNLNPPYPTGDIELVAFEWWTAPKMRISSIDSTNNIVYLTGPTLQVATQHGFVLNHRYIVENVKDLLTQGGQWFLDRSAVPWTLTYIANPGENPPTDTVVIPQSSQVMTATGLKYVTFQGLQFQNDNFTVSSTGYVSTQQEPTLTGAVSCYNCQYVTFNSDIITQTAGSGIEFKTTSTSSTTAYNTFENGALIDIGGIGLRVGEPPATTDTDANVPQFTTVENTLIEGVSRVFPSAPGIVQGSGHDNTYTYNDIYDVYHSGIEVCLAATCPPGKTNSSGTFNNVASFNHIFDLYEGVTDDGGAIYFATGGPAFTAVGNKILNNKIHDTSDASIIDSDGYGGNGINLDGSTGLVTVQNNLVYRISAVALNQTHGPQLANLANTINNNIFSYARHGMIANGNPYPTYVCPSNPVTVFNSSSNLFYFDRKEAQGFYVQTGCEYSCGFPLTDLHNWQSNLYWRTDAAFNTDPDAFHDQPTADGTMLCGFGKYVSYFNFASWQGLGEDVTGVANQNPGFNNPAYPNDDYSLPNGSPGVGFVVFNPTEAGRSNPIINPTDTVNIPATFPTNFFNPATDY